jgi:hypothetical protein
MIANSFGEACANVKSFPTRLQAVWFPQNLGPVVIVRSKSELIGACDRLFKSSPTKQVIIQAIK